MNIIQTTPNPSGAYPAPHTWSSPKLPNGYAYFPAEFEAEFTHYGGFVVLTIADDTVTAIEPNIEAWEAWKAEQAEPSELSPEKQVATLKEQLEATDYKIIKCSEFQLAGLDLPYDIAELHAERQALRNAINKQEAQDE